MRVVHVNSYESAGGAARAARRLHIALRRIGVESRMVVSSKESADESVNAPATLWARGSEKLRRSLDGFPLAFYRNRSDSLFSPGLAPGNLVRRVKGTQPDLTHLHWLAHGFARVGALASLEGPVVWTLHDAWPFTGGCHYPGGCEQFEASCGRCPALGSTLSWDLSRIGSLRKKHTWKRMNLTIACPSRWMAGLAMRSASMGGCRVEVLPNGVDTEVFHPVERSEARALLGLDPHRHYVLFGASAGKGNRIKGFDLLLEALLLYRERKRTPPVELIFAGEPAITDQEARGLPVHRLGHLHDDWSLVAANCAADVVAVPSREENLANTVLEAFACGRPVVAFEVGGMPDMIRPASTGILVPPYNVEALADAIGWVVSDGSRWLAMSAACRALAIREYGLEIYARRYEALYRGLINGYSEGTAC